MKEREVDLTSKSVTRTAIFFVCPECTTTSVSLAVVSNLGHLLDDVIAGAVCNMKQFTFFLCSFQSPQHSNNVIRLFQTLMVKSTFIYKGWHQVRITNIQYAGFILKFFSLNTVVMVKCIKENQQN